MQVISVNTSVWCTDLGGSFLWDVCEVQVHSQIWINPHMAEMVQGWFPKSDAAIQYGLYFKIRLLN